MPLKVLKTTEYDSSGKTRASKRTLAEEKYDLEWNLRPSQFNSEATALSLEQSQRIKALFLPQVKGKKVVELGCGDGALSKAAASFGGYVTATDISQAALIRLEGIENLESEKHYVPYTSLPDTTYDYVIASNLIAELPKEEYRLFFSELARIVKKEGQVIVATPLDINTEEALELFLYYAETELEIETLLLSYHRLYLRVSGLLKKIPFLRRWLEQSKRALFALEGLTKLIYDKEGASHVIILAKPRSLIAPS